MSKSDAYIEVTCDGCHAVEVVQLTATAHGWDVIKCHYMVDGRSLCKKWMYLGTDYEQRPANNGDCATCRKKYDATIRATGR